MLVAVPVFCHLISSFAEFCGVASRMVSYTDQQQIDEERKHILKR